MLEEQENLILKTSQPKGQSGLPLAAEMILRAIAEQVEKLADTQLCEENQGNANTELHLHELTDELGVFFKNLKTQLEDMCHVQYLNQSIEAHWTQTLKSVGELILHQRAFQSEAKLPATQCASHLQRLLAQLDEFPQISQSSEKIALACRHVSDSSKTSAASIKAISELISTLFQHYVMIESDNTQAHSEIVQLRSQSQKAISAWNRCFEEFKNKIVSVDDLLDLTDSLKSTAHHLQVLVVNIGIEAAKTDLHESSLDFIASDLRKVSNQFASRQREMTHKLLALREQLDGLQETQEIFTRDLALGDDTSARFSPKKRTSLETETTRLKINNEIEKVLQNLLQLTQTASKMEQETQLKSKKIKDFQLSLSTEIPSLKQAAQSFDRMTKDSATHDTLTEALKADLEILRTRKMSLSESLKKLKKSAESLQAETEVVVKAAGIGATFPSSENTTSPQVSEIKEQLKQCAQEIFSIVDSPDIQQRTAS